MKPTIIIIGAGGHGKVVCDAIIAQNKYQITGFVDSSLPIDTPVFANFKVICKQDQIENLKNKADFFIVAVGNNQVRAHIYNALLNLFKPATIIHPSAVIGSEVQIGEGSVILANAVLSAKCTVGINSIVNAAVVLDHECEIGNHVYLKLGTIVANNTIVEDYYTSNIAEKIIPASY